ncbi:DUF2087 domain-containing protein [Peribacillus sp. SCS-26]|uniref:DUF2087 domain-containing protein n=1 Tax=Paraperibacillus marinus TaxID=3115295 RepID=UPI0039064C63
MDEAQMKYQQSILRNFFDAEERLKSIPGQKKKKLVVLEHLAAGLDPHKKYTEKELNEYIKQYHEDFCTLRREFIVHGFMDREDSVYHVHTGESRTRWQDL